MHCLHAAYVLVLSVTKYLSTPGGSFVSCQGFNNNYVTAGKNGMAMILCYRQGFTLCI